MRALSLYARLAWLVCGSLTACAAQHPRPPDAGFDLPDHTAGKGCTRDADCANGRCAQAVHVASMAPTVAAPGGYCTTDCGADRRCGSGAECVVLANADRGECLANCTLDKECRTGYRCIGPGRSALYTVSGTCQPKPATEKLGADLAGQACASDSDCKGGECASSAPLGTAFPGNYCSADCLADSECGRNGACLILAGSTGAGRCFRHCETDADCTREGYRCRAIASGFNACYPAPPPLPDNTAGQACGSDDDCGGVSGSCAHELPYGNLGLYPVVAAKDGYCTEVCNFDADCGAGAHCISHGTAGGMCLASCTSASDCRSGYRCVTHPRPSRSDQICIPDDTSRDASVP